MANKPRSNPHEAEPSPKVEQTHDEGETKPKGETVEKIKKDEAMDDRFQATDN